MTPDSKPIPQAGTQTPETDAKAIHAVANWHGKGEFGKLAVSAEDYRQLETERNELRQQLAEAKAPRMAPVQGFSAGIPWGMHLRAYDVYCKKYGRQEALITGWCRGGFHTSELDQFIPGWREELSEMAQLKAQLAAATQEAEQAKQRASMFDDPKVLHAHCVRSLTAAQVAHLFGERMTEIQNERDALRAQLTEAQSQLKAAQELLHRG